MKYQLIDSNSCLMSNILHISDVQSNLLNEKRLLGEPEEIIHKIRKDQENIHLILIYINYKTDNLNRSDNAGILLLKYLRLYHIQQHCVLYSFLSREQLIKQDVRNLIIFSEGVTFIRLPADLTSLNYEELAEKKAPDDLSQYFRAGFDLPEDNRHNWANWWGLERLWQVHQAVVMRNKEDFYDYRNSPFRKKMASLEALTAMYLYPINSEKLKEIQISNEIAKLENGIRACNEILRNEKNQQDITKLKGKIESSKTKIQNLCNNVSSGEAIATLRNEITINNRNIILLDDQSNDGWQKVFMNILYNKIDKYNEPLSAPKINDEYNTCLGSINEATDIILLDLRLKHEQGQIHDISKLSGVILLKEIINRHPGLPVVMITASNKVSNYQTLMDLGADAYWVKEGLDSRFNEKESFDNYYQFLTIIKKLSGKEYRLLKVFSECVDKIKKTSNPWWAAHTWKRPYRNTTILVTQKDGQFISDVSDLLDYGVMLYRNWLKMFLLNSQENENNNKYKGKLLANIINTLSGIVELIHGENNGTIKKYSIGAEFKSDTVEVKRGDFLGFYLYCMRNLGSHFQGATTVSYDFFEFFIKALFTWLSVKYSEFEIQDIGIKDSSDFNNIVYDSENLKQSCEHMVLIKSKGNYKYYKYANFYSSFGISK